MIRGVFKESQSFKGTWVMYLFLLHDIPVLLLVLILVIKKGEDYLPFIVVAAVMLLAFLLLISIKLTTKIDQTGIHLSYFPFGPRRKTIKWELIQKLEMEDFNPMSFQLKIEKGVKNYRLIGSKVLIIEYGNSQTIRLGTQKDKELKHFIANWKEGKQHAK